MGAPTIYRWDDTDAPVLSGTVGALVALLKACLVDGYGSKVAVGWSLDYVNGDSSIGCFSNSTGLYIQVDHATSATWAHFKAFEAMSAYDTGLNQFSTSTNVSKVSSSASSDGRCWMVIADDRCFYLVTWFGHDSSLSVPGVNGHIMFFGDIETFADDGDDPWCCTLHGTPSISSGYQSQIFNSSSASASGGSFGLARGLDGVAGGVSASQVFGGGPGLAGQKFGAVGTTRIVGWERFSRPYISDGAAYSVRGRLPGLWHPLNLKDGFDQLETVTVGDRTMLMIKCEAYSYGTGCGAIDISENFRA